MENVFSLADSNICKVDASKSNTSEVLQDSNVNLSGILENIVKSSVGAAENDGKFDLISSVNELKIFDNSKTVKKML